MRHTEILKSIYSSNKNQPPVHIIPTVASKPYFNRVHV